jgi:hypothetical protein
MGITHPAWGKKTAPSLPTCALARRRGCCAGWRRAMSGCGSGRLRRGGRRGVRGCTGAGGRRGVGGGWRLSGGRRGSGGFGRRSRRGLSRGSGTRRRSCGGRGQCECRRARGGLGWGVSRRFCRCGRESRGGHAEGDEAQHVAGHGHADDGQEKGVRDPLSLREAVVPVCHCRFGRQGSRFSVTDAAGMMFLLRMGSLMRHGYPKYSRPGPPGKTAVRDTVAQVRDSRHSSGRRIVVTRCRVGWREAELLRLARRRQRADAAWVANVSRRLLVMLPR